LQQPQNVSLPHQTLPFLLLSIMVKLKDIEGRVFCFRSKSECAELGIPNSDIDEIVRIHKVILLDWVPGRKGWVKVMTITSKLREDWEYLPIAPTRKKPFPIQLQFRNGPEFIQGNVRMLNVTKLPLFSYLRIDESYEVPLEMMEEVVDPFGDQFMLRLSHQGGLKQLRGYLQRLETLRRSEMGRPLERADSRDQSIRSS